MPNQDVRVVGRYALYGAIAAGGMATVHLGRLLGPVGFSRTVAIKRLHAQFASDPEFVSMFLDEARLAARIRHPNVVPTLDVVATGGELFLVMEYIPGESLARLTRALREHQQTIPLRIVSSVMAGVLHGLHAAHEARDERGHPLGIVHRDVSPQNVLVGTDGIARVLDFGVAKAAGRMQTTREGQIKGKLSYMPPEQLRGAAVSRQTDIYAAGVMLWEIITGQRLFAGDNEGVIVAKILEGRVERPSQVLMRSHKATLTNQTMQVLEALDETILRALQMKPENRFATAREMAIEIERRCPPATTTECSDWVESIARDVLRSRAAMVAEIESGALYTTDSVREDPVKAVLEAKQTLSPGVPLPAAVPAPSGTGYAAATGAPMPTGRSSQPSFSDPQIAPLPPVTQPSSISVSSGSLHPRRDDAKQRATLAAVIAGGVLGTMLFIGGVAWVKARTPASIEADPPAAEEVDIPTAEPTTASGQGSPPLPPVTSVASTPAPVIEVEEDEVVDAGAQAQAPTPPTPAKPASTAQATSGASRPAPRPTSKPQTTPANDCATPFWYDSTGVKKYKEHCLQK